MKGDRSDWLLAAPVSATNSKADTPLFPFLARLIRGENLNFDEAADFFWALTAQDADPLQIAAALTALTAKGETFEELAGMASVMRRNTVPMRPTNKKAVDITGTGSSPAKTFNVSTAAAFVAAGAGLTVAKQSNRGVMSHSGSADVLKELGVKLAAEPGPVQAGVSGMGLSFLFTPKFHPTLINVGAVKHTLGIRTCLNILGLLANPVRVSGQLVGVWHRSLVLPVAKALALLKTQRAWVVHGSDGLDEITLAGGTGVVELNGENIRHFKLTPNDFGLKPGKIDHLRVENAKESAAIVRDVLASKRRDEARSLVVMNAAAALVIGNLAKDPIHAARMAEQSIDSGMAQNKLERLIQTSNKK